MSDESSARATFEELMRHTPPPVVVIAKAIPEFAPLARTTVRLHPREGECGADESKIGGLFLWPKAEPWPTCDEHNSPLVSVLQLRAEEFPEIEFPVGQDLFQLLWCPNDHKNTEPLYFPAPKIFWRNRGGVADCVTSAPTPYVDPEGYTDYVPTACVLHPERVAEFPDVFDIADRHPNLMAKLVGCTQLRQAMKRITEFKFCDPETLYQYWLSVAAGTKMGGYPEWCQDPAWPNCRCGRAMDYVLTIGSLEFDGGSWGRWLAVEDRHVYTGDGRDRKSVQQAANIMLGDCGEMNLFLCRKCVGWPIKAIVQCS